VVGAKAFVVEEERALKAVAAESMAKTAERCLFRIIIFVVFVVLWIILSRVKERRSTVVFLAVPSLGDVRLERLLSVGLDGTELSRIEWIE